jgi:hypothetical protein
MEYPKALYRQGAFTTVANKEEEAAERKEGWRDWAEDQTPEDKPRRKAK